jgi:hypothetical protein
MLAGVNARKLSVYTERLFRKLGITDASFHSLWHTAASWLDSSMPTHHRVPIISVDVLRVIEPLRHDAGGSLLPP